MVLNKKEEKIWSVLVVRGYKWSCHDGVGREHMSTGVEREDKFHQTHVRTEVKVAHPCTHVPAS